MSPTANPELENPASQPNTGSGDSAAPKRIELDHAITPLPRRIAILTATLLENLFFSGIIFGWPALFYMLKSEHIYENLCHPRNVSSDIGAAPLRRSAKSTSGEESILATTMQSYHNTTSNLFAPTEANIDAGVIIINQLFTDELDCSRQENVLNMAYTIGIFAMGFTSFAWGFMLESYGLRFVRLALNFLISFGCALLCITTEEHSHLIIPAIIILGLIGVPLRIANMQIADLFPRKRSTVITFFSGAFSASPVVFVLLKYGYDYLDLSYFTVMLSLFFLSLAMLPVTFCLLPKHSVRNREFKLLDRWEQYCAVTTNNSDQTKPRFVNKQKLYSMLQKSGNQKNSSVLDLFLSVAKVSSSLKPEDAQELQCLQSASTESNGTKNFPVIVKSNTQANSRGQKQSKLMKLFRGKATKDDIPLSVSLFSLSFLAHQLWFSWLNTYMVLYSGSMTLWLARVTDDVQTTRNFTQAFGLVQVSALIFAPLAGYIMDSSVASAFQEPDQLKRRLRQAQSGFVPILITTVTLTCAVVCRFFDTPFAVYISIVFITLLRSFLIAVASAYIRVRFPASHFNRLNGIMCTTGAFFSLFQFPLFYFESLSDWHAFYVNVFCAVMTVLSMLNPLCLGITPLQRNLLTREDEHQRRLQSSGKSEQGSNRTCL